MVIGRGMEEDSIKNLAKNMGLENSVRFLGVRNDVADVLNACDCFLLPSLYEGLPVVLIETQTNGLKAIVSDRVTTELAVTDLVEFLPISEDAVEIWADKICSYRPLTMDMRKRYFKKTMAAFHQSDAALSGECWYTFSGKESLSDRRMAGDEFWRI